MSHSQKRMLAAGAVMVGLSSFVPNPFMTGKAFAQATASTTLHMAASVVNPLAISQSTSLNWGQFAVNGGGNVTIKAAAATAVILPAVGFKLANGTAGKVHISAPASATFTLSITDVFPQVMKTAGWTALKTSASIVVDRVFIKGAANLKKTVGGTTLNSSSLKAGNQDIQNINITGAGATTFNWGVRGVLKNNQKTGAYTGTFTFLTTL